MPCGENILKRNELDKINVEDWSHALNERKANRGVTTKSRPSTTPPTWSAWAKAYTAGQVTAGSQPAEIIIHLDERQQPTGSFKDRQATVAISP
jgi:threonine synthase